MSDHDPAKDWYDFVPPNEALDHNPLLSVDFNPKSSHTAALHFDLTDPEGERRLREMLDALKWKCAVWEFERWLRSEMDNDKHSQDCLDVIEWVFERLFECFNDEGIDLMDE